MMSSRRTSNDNDSNVVTPSQSPDWTEIDENTHIKYYCPIIMEFAMKDPARWNGLIYEYGAIKNYLMFNKRRDRNKYFVSDPRN